MEGEQSALRWAGQTVLRGKGYFWSKPTSTFFSKHGETWTPQGSLQLPPEGHLRSLLWDRDSSQGMPGAGPGRLRLRARSSPRGCWAVPRLSREWAWPRGCQSSRDAQGEVGGVSGQGGELDWLIPAGPFPFRIFYDIISRSHPHFLMQDPILQYSTKQNKNGAVSCVEPCLVGLKLEFIYCQYADLPLIIDAKPCKLFMGPWEDTTHLLGFNGTRHRSEISLCKSWSTTQPTEESQIKQRRLSRTQTLMYLKGKNLYTIKTTSQFPFTDR